MNSDIWSNAAQVVKIKSREGAKATIAEDGALVVKIDGRQIKDNENDPIEKLLKEAIQHMVTSKSKEDFNFYSTVLKPLIISKCRPQMYEKVLGAKLKSSDRLFGVMIRTNKADQIEL